MENHDNDRSSRSSPDRVWSSPSPSDNLLLPSSDKSAGERRIELVLQPQRLRTKRVLASAVAAIVLVASGVAYFIVSDRAASRQSVEDAIADAQVSIGEAVRRLDALPSDHPLRGRANELEDWRRTLDGYSKLNEPTGLVREQAERYAKAADEISEQARAALNVIEALGREDSVRKAATPPQQGDAPNSEAAVAGSGPAHSAHNSARVSAGSQAGTHSSR
ncbi:MAG: hypothetical protein ACREDR_03195 [Blastocatellia bacterium]